MTEAKKGDSVRIFYTGKLDDGTVFDTSENQSPLEFTLGRKEVIRGFEQAVIGMCPGELKTITLSAEHAYGPYHEELVADLSLDEVPGHLTLEVGNHLELTQSDGQPMVVRVTAISENMVTLDANHPLAGKDLTFEIKLLEIL